MSARSRLALTAVLLLAGGMGVLWALYLFAGHGERAEVRDVAELILGGEKLPSDTASLVLGYLDRRPVAACGARLVADRAVIRLYVASGAHLAGQSDAPFLLSQAREDIRQALACAPFNGYLWYGLFWVEMTQGARPTEYLPLLEFSYEIAPREGWLARYRSADALAQFERLTPKTQDTVRAEYLSVAKERPSLAVGLFRDADPAGRARLLGWIPGLSLGERRQLAVQFDAADLVVDVPGVTYRQGRTITDPKQE